MTDSPVRIVVLASGSGTLLQALLDSSLEHHLVAVGSDVVDCGALARARARGIETFVVSVSDFASRAEWDRALLDHMERIQPTLVVSAGFMRILGPSIVERWSDRIINTHPALLPAFPGAHAVRDALAYGVKVTGCTVHFVDQGVDTGPIIAQQAVTIFPDDTENTLHERIKEVERVLLIDVIETLIAESNPL